MVDILSIVLVISFLAIVMWVFNVSLLTAFFILIVTSVIIGLVYDKYRKY